MFDRYFCVLPLCLTLCFCLIIFVAVQEKRQFTGMKNINIIPTENDNVLNNNEIESLKEDLEKLIKVINSLSFKSDETDIDFEVLKKRFDKINDQVIEPKDVIFLFRQLLKSIDIIIQVKRDLSNSFDSLQNSASNLDKSFDMLDKSFDMLKEMYEYCRKTNELNQMNPLNSSPSSQTTNPVSSEEQAVEQNSMKTNTLQFYDDDNAEGSYPIMEMNTSNTDETEESKSNDVESVTEMRGHSDHTEGSYSGEMELQNSESDENVSKNTDSEINPVTTYDHDSSEGSHLVTESYYLTKDIITEDFLNSNNSDNVMDLESSLETHHNNSMSDVKGNNDIKALAVNVNIEDATEDVNHLTSTNINSDDEGENGSGDFVHYTNCFEDSDEDMINDNFWQDKQEITDEPLIGSLPRDDEDFHRELYRHREETLFDRSPDYLDTTVSIFDNQQQEEFSLFINKTVSVLESIKICEIMGMRLATILSKEEQEKVVALIKKTGQEFPHVIDNDFWISGLVTDSKDKDYLWLNPLSAELDEINYTNWNQGHQRIFSDFLDIRYVCVFLGHQLEFSWSSADCMESGRYAVCRRSSSNKYYNSNNLKKDF